MKSKKQKPKFVRICPKCKSLDIIQEAPGVSSNIIFGFPTQYRCKNCGFKNYIFPEVDITHVKIKDKKPRGKCKSNC